MLDFDCVVIGAGPAGLATSLYLKRAGLNVLLVDKDAPGGKLLKAKKIENYMGFSSISGADLALKMYSQVKALDVPFMFGAVTDITGSYGDFSVTVSEKVIKCGNVIIATGRGAGAFSLDDGNIEGISYCAICDGSFYKGKCVGVYGKGKELYEDALYLADLCGKVYVFDKSSSDSDLNRLSSYSNIVRIGDSKIKELLVSDSHLSGVIMDNSDSYDLSGLFIVSSGGFNIPLDLEKVKGYIKVSSNMETSIKGIYACGDVIYKDFYQISTAINDGIIAALSIKRG